MIAGVNRQWNSRHDRLPNGRRRLPVLRDERRVVFLHFNTPYFERRYRLKTKFRKKKQYTRTQYINNTNEWRAKIIVSRQTCTVSIAIAVRQGAWHTVVTRHVIVLTDQVVREIMSFWNVWLPSQRFRTYSENMFENSNRSPEILLFANEYNISSLQSFQ